MTTLWHDIRYGARRLMKTPGFTVVVVSTLALGIGANTAVFSVVDQVLLRRLPVHDPLRLVLLSPTGPHPGSNMGSHALSYPMYRDLRDHNPVFDGLLCRFRFAASLGYQDQTERMTAEMVSGNYFDVLGIHAAIGRTISPDDDRSPGAHPVAVLSYRCWEGRFAGDRDILGKTIRVNGRPLTVIGASEDGFDGVEPGVAPEVRVPMMMAGEMIPYPREQAAQVYQRLKERLEAIPGIDSVALGMIRLLGGEAWDTGILVRGYRPGPGEDRSSCVNAISEDYFRTLRIPFLAGRDFRPSDGANSSPVAIVNERFARHFFGERGAVGQHIGSVSPVSKAEIEIIGVVKDAKYERMWEDIPSQVFIPYRQLWTTLGMTGYIRTRLSPEQACASVRIAVREVDSSLPIHATRTLREQCDWSLSTERLVALLAAVFGALATVLAAMGLYGVLAYSVACRTRELGLRIALGAQSTGVIWLVLKEVMGLWVGGAVVALPAALVLGRLVESQLYGIAPSDPWTIGAATLLLAVVAMLAAVIPARRAAKVDPMEALRHE